MSGLIDEFELESEKGKKEVREKEEKEEKEEGIEEKEKKRDVGEEEEKKKEIVEELRSSVNEIDAIFSICVAKASKLVSKLPVSEHTRASMMMEIGKLYFFEVRRTSKRG